jgi:hypothetical protein
MVRHGKSRSSADHPDTALPPRLRRELAARALLGALDEYVREVVRDAVSSDGWIDQHASPLGKRAHLTRSIVATNPSIVKASQLREIPLQPRERPAQRRARRRTRGDADVHSECQWMSPGLSDARLALLRRIHRDGAFSGVSSYRLPPTRPPPDFGGRR